MNVPEPPPAPNSPFTAPPTREHLEQLATAKQQFRKVGRAIKVANFDAWTVAIFGGLTFIVALASVNVVGLLLGGGMSVVAYIEFVNTAKLRRLELDAPKKLAINQLALGSLLMGYAVYSLLTPPSMAQYADLAGAGQMGDKMASDLTQMTTMIYNLVYVALIAIAIGAQGGTALFYLSRKRHLLGYLQQTPPWILEMQRAGITV